MYTKGGDDTCGGWLYGKMVTGGIFLALRGGETHRMLCFCLFWGLESIVIMDAQNGYDKISEHRFCNLVSSQPPQFVRGDSVAGKLFKADLEKDLVPKSCMSKKNSKMSMRNFVLHKLGPLVLLHI